MKTRSKKSYGVDDGDEDDNSAKNVMIPLQPNKTVIRKSRMQTPSQIRFWEHYRRMKEQPRPIPPHPGKLVAEKIRERRLAWIYSFPE